MPPADGAPIGRHAALVGPTASGKSAVALALARHDPAWEIVTVDSMQVYRGMDIGTAKPTPAERAEVPHHVVDVADPWDDFDVATYQRLATAAIADIDGRGGRALLVGGTTLYLRAVVDRLEFPGRHPEVLAELDDEPDTPALHRRLAELDPTAAARMEPTNRRRVVRALEVTLGTGRPFSSFGPGLDEHPETPFTLIALRWDRSKLDRRIEARYRHQLAAGFVDEVRALVTGPRPLSRSAAQALGYKEIAEHVLDGRPLDECVDLAVRRTRRFARRQERWLRRDPRIHWVAGGDDAVEHVRNLVASGAE